MSAGWPRVALRELLAAPLSNGRSVKDQPGGFPVLRLTALRDGVIDISEHKEGAWTAVEAARFLVSENDFLVARGNGSIDLVGRGALAAKVSSPVAYPDTMIRIRVDQRKVAPRFLALAWNAPEQRRQIERLARTTAGIYKINQKHLESIDLPLPPLDEQRQIVDIIEDHLSRLDAAIRTLRSSRERLLILRLSTLRRIRDVALSAGSPLRRIGEVAQTDLGKMLDAKRAVGGPTPYLRNVNVRWGQVDLSDIRTVPLTERERTDFALQRGDLLVCEGGEPGRCAIWNADAASLMTYQKALHRVRVRPDADVSAEFLALMIEEFIRTGRASRLFTGTTIKHLPQEKLRMIELPVPPIYDQQEAVRRVKETTSNSARFSSEILRAESMSEGLQRSLLRAAFSGRLTSRPSTLSLGEQVTSA